MGVFGTIKEVVQVSTIDTVARGDVLCFLALVNICSR